MSKAAQTNDQRRRDLARIHIAKKDMVLDDETYRSIIRNIGKVKSGSSADLSPTGRGRVLQYFKEQGWRPRSKRNVTKKRTTDTEILASDGEVKLIRSIWIQMADAGVVHERSEPGLRRWVLAATRRYHPDGVGYSAPEFLPDWVAQRTIEHMKQWARRCEVQLNQG